MQRIATLLFFATFTTAAPAQDGPIKDAPVKDAAAQDDLKLFEKVMARLLASDDVKETYPEKFAWPPKHFVKLNSKKEVNAYASAHPSAGAIFDEKEKKVRPVVMVTQGMLQQIVKGDENSLAVIMGHELAHLSKEHVLRDKVDTAFLFLAFSRDQEIEADLEGVRFTLSAGYPYKVGVASAIQKMREQTKYTSFEGLGTTHPTWEERLVFLDREQSKLWSSMSAFRNGLLFMELEQYQSAQQCLKAVVNDFPDCQEAWANLGYAQLMQYCDGLDKDDLKRFGIGQIVAGGFYRRPTSLEAKVRGVDEKLWMDAVKSCRKAIALDAELALPRAALGVAHLVHPDGKDVKRAAKFFAEALEKAKTDPGLKKNALAQAALFVNAGVAELAAGKTTEAADLFQQADSLTSVGRSPLAQSLEDAILFNRALAESKSKSAGDKKKALDSLDLYLKSAHSDSAWWSLALDRYNLVAKELEKPAKTADNWIKEQTPATYRLQTSVTVGKDAVALSEPLQSAVQRLGESDGVAVPLFAGAKIHRWKFNSKGVDLIGKDKVTAIFLWGEKAPPLVLRPYGVASKPVEMRVGMTESEAKEILKDQYSSPELFPILDQTTRYRVYPELGLAVRVRSGRIKEVVVALVPRVRFAEK